MKLSVVTLLVLIGFVGTGARAADEGSAILTQRCAGCHNLTGPAPHTLKELWARKAPDLFYAGNKYRDEWLRAWLQKPTRIRVAGEFYADHIRSGEKSDEVDPATLEPHLALSAADADTVTQALMRLKPHAELIAAEKIEPGLGGASGPELYTAGRRLQPAFIASYIRSPQAWDPKIWMPNKRVSDSNIQKLVHYLAELAKEQGNAK